MPTDLSKYKKATTTPAAPKRDLSKYKKSQAPEAPAQDISFLTSREPTFKASEGGAETILPNVMKTLGNIPSSARNLTRNAIAPVNPLDLNSPVNIGSNIVNSAEAATALVKERGVGGAARSFAKGVVDTGVEAGRNVADFTKQAISDPSSVAKVGVEDPLLIPSLLVGPRGVGVKTDLVEKAASPVTTATSRVAQTGPAKKVIPDVLTKDVQTLRTNKITKGLSEQNTRLKTVGKSFKDNTIVRKDPEAKTTTTITPIDTFAKYQISPTVENGTIKMGDWDQGTGALGKLKENVDRIDDDIDGLLTKHEKSVPLTTLKEKMIAAAKADPDLKRAGKVGSTVSKIDNIFADYAASYGSDLSVSEINAIRKVANRDFHPDTMDTSRVLGDAAREVVYDAVPDNAVRTLLREQGALLAAKKYAKTVDGTKAVGGRLGNYALRTVGAVVGSTTQLPVVGPVLGAIGGEYAARALQQSQFKSLGAETKALFQRSNKNQQTNSATAIPNKAIPNSIQGDKKSSTNR
jgi:hypothetical protein